MQYTSSYRMNYRWIFLGSAGVIGVLLVVGVFFPDAYLYLRTQVAPIVPTEITNTFSWTPPDDSELGDRTLTIEAMDDKGNRSTKDVTIEVLPSTAGARVSNVQIVSRLEDADLSFEVSEAATTQVAHDVFRNLRRARSKRNDREALTHTYVLDQLKPCTRYRYQITGTTRGGGAVAGGLRAFVTKGCPGEATVRGNASGDVAANQASRVVLDTQAVLTIPAGAASSDVHVQILQLDREAALGAIAAPAGLEPISGLYEMKALTDTATVVSAFQQPVSVTIAYTPAANTNPATVAIHRWDGSVWQRLDACAPDTAAGSVTCTTTDFSTFGVFGQGGSSGDAPPAGDGDGGAGTSGDADGGEPPSQPKRVLTFQAETGHAISGSYSGVEPNKRTVKLAHPRAILAKKVTTSPGNYWFELHARHDVPGPVRVAVYLNNRAWKVFTLDKNDNRYRTHRVGLLRNFQGATIRFRFRFLNDRFKLDPSGNYRSDLDRDFHIDWWRLVPEGS